MKGCFCFVGHLWIYSGSYLAKAEEEGHKVDIEGFNIAMDGAKEMALTTQTKAAGGSIVLNAYATSELYRKRVAITNASYNYIWNHDHKSVIKAIYTGAELLDSVLPGISTGIILESTVFYAEKSGRIYYINSLEGTFCLFEVTNVQVFGGFVLHIVLLSWDPRLCLLVKMYSQRLFHSTFTIVFRCFWIFFVQILHLARWTNGKNLCHEKLVTCQLMTFHMESMNILVVKLLTGDFLTNVLGCFPAPRND